MQRHCYSTQVIRIIKSAFAMAFFCVVFCLQGFASESITFQGVFNFQSKMLNVFVSGKGQDDIHLNAEQVSDNRYLIKITFNAFPFFETSFKSNVSVDVRRKEINGNDFIQADLKSEYTLFGGKPLREIEGSIGYYQGKLNLSLIEFGPFLVQGYIAPEQKRQIDITLNYMQLDLEHLVNWGREKDNPWRTFGTASGKIRLLGELNNPVIQGDFNSYNGYIDTFDYESLLVRFEGFFPIVRVFDSTVTKEGSLTGALNGEFDLRQMNNLMSQFRALRKSAIISSESKDQVDWVFKRMSVEDDLKGAESKYFLRQDKGFMGKEGHGMFGMEKKIGF